MRFKYIHLYTYILIILLYKYIRFSGYIRYYYHHHTASLFRIQYNSIGGRRV